MSPESPDTEAGREKLTRFLLDHKISVRAAGRALQVKHQTVMAWRDGRAKPEPAARKAIAVWTNEAVPEACWETAEERKRVERFAAVTPFETPEPGGAPPPAAFPSGSPSASGGAPNAA